MAKAVKTVKKVHLDIAQAARMHAKEIPGTAQSAAIRGHLQQSQELGFAFEKDFVDYIKSLQDLTSMLFLGLRHLEDFGI